MTITIEQLKDKSKALRIAAMKSKQDADKFASAELIGAISEAEGEAKKGMRDVTNEDVVTAINRGVKRINDMMETLSKTGAEVPQEYTIRKNALLDLLPKQMDEKELEDVIVNTIFSSLGGIGSLDKGKIMKALKERYNGQYDGKMANAVITKILSV